MCGAVSVLVSIFLQTEGGGSCALFFVAAGMIAGIFYIADRRRAREMKRICSVRRGEEEHGSE